MYLLSGKITHQYAPGSFWSPGSSRSPSPAVCLRDEQWQEQHAPITPKNPRMDDPAGEGSCSGSQQEPSSTTMSVASVSVKQYVSRNPAVLLAVRDEHAQTIHTPTSQSQLCDPPMQCSDEEDLHPELSDAEFERPMEHMHAKDTAVLQPNTQTQFGSDRLYCAPPASDSSSSVAGEGQPMDAECSHTTVAARQNEPKCCGHGGQKQHIKDSLISFSPCDQPRMTCCPAVCPLNQGEGDCGRASSEHHPLCITIATDPSDDATSAAFVAVASPISASYHSSYTNAADIEGSSLQAGQREGATLPAQMSPNPAQSVESEHCVPVKPVACAEYAASSSDATIHSNVGAAHLLPPTDCLSMLLACFSKMSMFCFHQPFCVQMMISLRESLNAPWRMLC